MIIKPSRPSISKSLPALYSALLVAIAPFLTIILIACAEPTAVNARFTLEVSPPDWVNETDTETEIGSTGFSRAVAGGLKIQQINAETSAKLKLSDRISAIALHAANEIFDKEADRHLARDAALMAVALTGDGFYRAAIAWSPAQDYFTLFRVSYEDIRAALEAAMEWTLREASGDQAAGDQNGGAGSFDKLRIDKAIDRAIAAEKEGGV